jgi:hypothetical protein
MSCPLIFDPELLSLTDSPEFPGFATTRIIILLTRASRDMDIRESDAVSTLFSGTIRQ